MREVYEGFLAHTVFLPKSAGHTIVVSHNGSCNIQSSLPDFEDEASSSECSGALEPFSDLKSLADMPGSFFFLASLTESFFVRPWFAISTECKTFEMVPFEVMRPRDSSSSSPLKSMFRCSPSASPPPGCAKPLCWALAVASSATA